MEQDELKQLGEAFASLGVKPKCDTKEDLMGWMAEYLATQGKPPVKEEKEEEEKKKEKKRDDKKDEKKDYRPRLSQFTNAKDGASYEVWKFEVECLEEEGHPEETIRETIRRSVRGDPAKTLMRLGKSATLKEILKKFDGVYGKVVSESTLLTMFYSASQKKDEDVTAWSSRLEDLIQTVEDNGMIEHKTKQEMLRSKLWNGLYNEKLKEATRYKFDIIKDYEQLIVGIRAVEQELAGIGNEKDEKDVKKAKTQSIQKSEDRVEATLKRMEEKMDRLDKELKEVKEVRGNQDTGYTDRGRGSYRGSHRYNRGRGSRSDNRGRGYQGRGYQGRGRGQSREKEDHRDKEDHSDEQDVVCYRCGDVGHIALGCRRRTDHMRHLNEESPLSGGSQ